jgi:hypothetical protein
VEKRRGGFRRIAVLVAVASVGILAVGVHAASAQVIEICKASTNGMSGRTFTYSITGGASVSVNGGRCSGPITVAGAQVTITEGQSNPATDVASVTVRPSIRKVSEDLVNRSVTVTTGATTSSETLVTFTNQPAGGNVGTLKVCKLTQTPAYLGRLFSFSVNGGPLVSTEANDAFDNPANWSCRILGNFQVGSTVVVKEAIPAGTEVQFIDSDPATALVDFDLTAGTGTYTIGAGTTVALFDDEPIPPSGTGTLEICKTAAQLALGYADPDVHGPFTFTAVDAGGNSYGPFTINVPNPNLGGIYCTEPFTVAAGIAEVTEGPSPGFDLVDAFTNPTDRFLSANLINRTVDVEVPSSTNPNDETQVVFVNQTQRAQLKLCKTLGPGSADLIGTTFYINWSSDSGASGTTPITARATTQCVIVGNLPIGATVSLAEQDPGQFVDSSGPSSITLTPGINTATFTNTARGLLEVCKARVAGINTQPTFTYRIDGAGNLTVRAGTCSLPQRVSVGNHTVAEVATDNYELDPNAPGNGITVSPSGAEVSRNLNTRTVTVNVPYASDVTVNYFNRIKQGYVKICKVIPSTSQDTLGGKQFYYDVYFRDPMGNVTSVRLGPIFPGECTSFYPPQPGPGLPVLQPNGNNTAIGVVEVPASGIYNYTVTSIALTSGTRGLCSPGDPKADPAICNLTPNPNLALGAVDFYLGPGNNIITYTNKANDP